MEYHLPTRWLEGRKLAGTADERQRDRVILPFRKWLVILIQGLERKTAVAYQASQIQAVAFGMEGEE